jgi:hypothetical protein
MADSCSSYQTSLLQIEAWFADAACSSIHRIQQSVAPVPCVATIGEDKVAYPYRRADKAV